MCVCVGGGGGGGGGVVGGGGGGGGGAYLWYCINFLRLAARASSKTSRESSPSIIISFSLSFINSLKLKAKCI